MKESKKLSPCENGTKDPDKGTNHGKKKKGSDTVKAEEDGSQERLEEDTTLFRAYNDREIETNRLRKFPRISNSKSSCPKTRRPSMQQAPQKSLLLARRQEMRLERADRESHRALEISYHLVDMHCA